MTTSATIPSVPATTMQKRPKGKPEWLPEMRRKSRKLFLASVWPTTLLEEWRRTDISALNFNKFRSVEPDPVRSRTVTIPGDQKPGLRFLDGHCTTPAPKANQKHRGLILSPIQNALSLRLKMSNGRELGSFITEQFEKLLRAADNKFQYWHFSEISHGAVVYVAPDTNAGVLHLEFEESGRQRLSCPNVVIILDKGAKAGIVHKISSQPGQELLCNSFTSIRLAENANLSYTRLQNLSMDDMVIHHEAAEISRSAILNRFDADLGAGLSKSRIAAQIMGSGGNVQLDGVFMASGNQHKDIRTVQQHCAENTISRAFYKGGARDASHTVFQGLIDVAETAINTDAFLANRNLRFNNNARADAIPSLKIRTNRVKCSHDATIGKIDKNQHFYLMTRGHSPAQAEDLLVRAFFHEGVFRAPETHQAEIEKLIGNRAKPRGDSRDIQNVRMA